jgi:hypothetical protein
MTDPKTPSAIPQNLTSRPGFNMEALQHETELHLALAARHHAQMVEAKNIGQPWEFHAAQTQIQQAAALLCQQQEQTAVLVTLLLRGDVPEKPAAMPS